MKKKKKKRMAIFLWMDEEKKKKGEKGEGGMDVCWHDTRRPFGHFLAYFIH